MAKEDPDFLKSFDGSPDEFKSKSEPSILLQLPNEIWAHIFQQLPQKERVNLRLVSKQWRERLDKLSTYNIEWGLIPVSYYDRLVNLRIRCCEFSGLKTLFEWKLRHPLLVKEITFGCHVGSANVKLILNMCTAVETLRFYSTVAGDKCFESEQDASQILSGLKNLKCLHFGNFSFGVNILRSSTFNAIFGNPNLQLSKLSTLHVNYAMYHREWKKLFRFIARHAHNLKGLCISCQCVPEREGSSNNHIYDVKDFMSVEEIERLKLNSLSVKGWIGSGCSCSIGDLLWMIFLNQESLMKAEVSFVNDPNNLKSVVKKNCSSLQIIKAYCINLAPTDSLDGSLFKECKNLTELSLSFSSAPVIVVSRDVKVHMFTMSELSNLPQNIKILRISASEFFTTDLIKMSEVLKKLTVIEFYEKELKSSGNHGITPFCFATMCQNLTNLERFSFRGNYINVGEDIESAKILWRKIHSVAVDMNIFCGAPAFFSEACDAFYSFKFLCNSIRCEFLSQISDVLNAHELEENLGGS